MRAVLRVVSPDVARNRGWPGATVIAALLPGGKLVRWVPLPPRRASQYALDALRIHGPIRGSWLATRRASRAVTRGRPAATIPVVPRDPVVHR